MWCLRFVLFFIVTIDSIELLMCGEGDRPGVVEQSTYPASYWKNMYENLGKKVQRFLDEMACADFYREYLPSVEQRFVNLNIKFSNTFEQNNRYFVQFYNKINDEDTYRSAEVYDILRFKFGMKLEDRKTCKFAYMTSEEFNSPIPDDLMKPENRGTFYKCEMWIYFLFVVESDPIGFLHPELRLWKLAIKEFEREEKLPYPLMTQRIMYGMYFANKFHDENNYQIDQILNKSLPGERRDKKEEAIFSMKRCLYTMSVQVSTSGTKLWTPPELQFDIGERNFDPRKGELFDYPNIDDNILNGTLNRDWA